MFDLISSIVAHDQPSIRHGYDRYRSSDSSSVDMTPGHRPCSNGRMGIFARFAAGSSLLRAREKYRR